jgi:hypothetical protein
MLGIGIQKEFDGNEKSASRQPDLVNLYDFQHKDYLLTVANRQTRPQQLPCVVNLLQLGVVILASRIA